MTVITKPISENKSEKLQEKPLLICLNEGTGVQCREAVDCHGRLNVDGGRGGGAGGGGGDPQLEYIDLLGGWGSTRSRRVSVTTTVCAFVVGLVMTSCLIIGGVYVYRQCTFTQADQMSRFSGWCGVSFRRNSLRVFGHQPMIRKQSPSSYLGSHNGGSADGIFNEQFNIDLGTESHEEIYVPDFGIGREGLFVHDFTKNLTGIVDVSTRRCFVLPLDNSQVVPARNMFRILQRIMQAGSRFADGNMLVIRQTLRVVRPPIRDLTTIGRYINQKCHDFTTYRLEKVTRIHDMRMKREADAPEEEEDQPYEQTDSHFTVAVFSGKSIVEYTIIDE